MNVKNWVAASILLPGLCLGVLPALAQQQQQQTGDPVADAARKAREQQKAAPKPKKVYTDDDVKPATPSNEGGAAAGSGGAQGAPDNGQAAAAGGTGTAPTGKEDAETMWRKRFADQRNKIAAAEKELDLLQRESEKAQVQYYSDPQKALMEQNTRKDINDKNAKIEQKKKEIADLKQQLSDLEDELRKSGGDSGWARE
jgi:DNA repair exonuclease SbcCD ATPase subunit